MSAAMEPYNGDVVRCIGNCLNQRNIGAYDR